MNKYKELMKIFFHYNNFVFKVQNSDYASILHNEEGFDAEQLKWCQKYISIVDEAIAKLDKYEQQLINHVYIQGLPRTDLPYSVATYYNKRNKALDKLNNLLVTTHINQFSI